MCICTYDKCMCIHLFINIYLHMYICAYVHIYMYMHNRSLDSHFTLPCARRAALYQIRVLICIHMLSYFHKYDICTKHFWKLSGCRTHPLEISGCRPQFTYVQIGKYVSSELLIQIKQKMYTGSKPNHQEASWVDVSAYMLLG